MLNMLKYLENDLFAELIIISNAPKVLKMALVPLPIPEDTPEWLTPLISIIPAQLFSYHLTLVKGRNPEKPRTIRKITETH